MGTLWIYDISVSCFQCDCGVNSRNLTFSCFHCRFQLATSPSEKDRFLSSVIRALEGLNESSVLARALVLRADLHLEASRYTEALQDAQRALTMPASKAIAFRAHRLCADAHEAQGRYPEAIECLLKLGANDSSFQTKINKEIQRLQSAIRR